MQASIFAIMETAGYIASLFIGISLGLIGGGGSILTVPVLVYLFFISPTVATSYSLFIVGTTSLVGSFGYFKKGLVDFTTVLLFGSSSISTVFIIRKFIVPALPNVFFKVGTFTVTQSLFLMLLFAILMVIASLSMIKSKEIELSKSSPAKILVLVQYRIIVGLVTGFLGAGGGFLLIPALVLILRLPIKTAIGTSLLIIALNSLIGFLGDIGHHKIDWKFILLIAAIAIIGIFIGSYFNQKVNATKLKKGFGWFVLVTGIYIIVKELIL